MFYNFVFVQIIPILMLQRTNVKIVLKLILTLMEIMLILNANYVQILANHALTLLQTALLVTHLDFIMIMVAT